MIGLLILFLLGGGDLDAAERALAAGRPEEAIEKLGDLAEAEDADPRAWVVRGRALLALGENEEAVEALVRASDAKPDDKALARDAAIACRRSAQGRYRRALALEARRLAQRAGDEAMLADIAFDAGDYEAALALYRRIGRHGSTHALMRTGDCLKLIGRADEAKEAYAAALEAVLKTEELPDAFRTAFAAGRPGRLLAWLDERIAARPDDLEARHYRGYARAAVAMYPEAIEDLRLYLGQNPRQIGVKDQLSFALLQHGVRRQDNAMIDEAAALAQLVLDADPNGEGVEAWQREAWGRIDWIAGYRWRNGDLEGVYALMKDLHARDSSDSRAALNFAMAARRLGRYDEARVTYEGMLADAPDDPSALNDYAILLDGLGDRAQARAQWEKLLAKEPGDLNALENLFTDAWERGDVAAARGYARRGVAAALEAEEPVDRWLWFEDRLLWAPKGHGG